MSLDESILYFKLVRFKSKRRINRMAHDKIWKGVDQQTQPNTINYIIWTLLYMSYKWFSLTMNLCLWILCSLADELFTRIKLLKNVP